MLQELPQPLVPSHYRALAGSERRAAPGARLLGPTDPKEAVSVTVTVRRRPDGPPMPDVLTLATMRGANRRTYTQAAFAARYGALPADIDQVTQFANSHGLTVVATSPTRRTVVLTGTAAQMGQAFAAPLGRYEHDIEAGYGGKRRSETFRGRSGPIYLPAALSGIVTGVFGLDNRTLTRRNGDDPPNTSKLSISEICDLYQFPGQDAAGQTIGIMSPTGGYGGFYEDDILQCFGSGLPNMPIVSIDGAANGCIALATTAVVPDGGYVFSFASTAGILLNSEIVGPGTSGYVVATTPTTVTLDRPVNGPVVAGSTMYFNPDFETTQDICIAATAAPGSDIAVYFSNGDQKGWLDMITRAVHPDAGDPICSVLSSSFYLCDGDDAPTMAYEGVSAAMLNAVSSALQDAAIQGVTVCVAAGDDGSNCKAGNDPQAQNGGDGRAHVQYPASDPWVLCVGGTTVGNVNGAIFDEYVWNEDDDGRPTCPLTTGGGVSDFFDLPAYQAKAMVPHSINPGGRIGRGIPDVAANASPSSGYQGVVLWGFVFAGSGTSAATPLWAALIARLNVALGLNLGFVNPLLYELGRSCFRDIDAPPGPTDNSNAGIAGYPAGKYWDACTGWGSPMGTSLLTGLQILLQHKTLIQKVAIDPLSLILPHEVYIQLHLSDPGPFLSYGAETLVKSMPEADRQEALARARAFGAYIRALERALESAG